MNYERELVQFEGYLLDHVSSGTVKVYMDALRHWFASLNGTNPSPKAAQAYVDTMAKRKSASTVSLRAHAIMRWFRWKGVQVRLDCPTIRMGEIEYLTTPQMDTVLAACTTVLERTLVTVLFDTAVRISELLNIELDDVDWDNGFISVVRKGGRKEEVNISGKGLTVLEEWLDVRSFKTKKVFMGLSYYDAWIVIKAIGKRAGIPLRPHIFRHSRAVFMLMNGATLHDVQMHLGHKSITTTANIYGRFKAVDLRERIPVW